MIIPAALYQVIPSIRLLLGSSKSESADEPPAKKRKTGPKRRSEKPKAKYIDQPGASVPRTDRLDGYTLMVRNSAGDKRMVDTTCDSEFMEDVMPDVGKVIRKGCHWVP